MEDRLELLKSAIYALNDAIDAIKRLGKHAECDVLCLEEMKRGYKRDYDEEHKEVELQDAADEEALIREYWRNVG